MASSQEPLTDPFAIALDSIGAHDKAIRAENCEKFGAEPLDLSSIYTVPLDTKEPKSIRGKRIAELDPYMLGHAIAQEECGKHATSKGCSRHEPGTVELVGKPRVTFCNQKFSDCCTEYLFESRIDKLEWVIRTILDGGDKDLDRFNLLQTIYLSVPVDRARGNLANFMSRLDRKLGALVDLGIDLSQKKHGWDDDSDGDLFPPHYYMKRHICGRIGNRIVSRMAYWGPPIPPKDIESVLRTLHPNATIQVRESPRGDIKKVLEDTLRIIVPKNQKEQGELEVEFYDLRTMETLFRSMPHPAMKHKEDFPEQDLFTSLNDEDVNNSDEWQKYKVSDVPKCSRCGKEPDVVNHRHPRFATPEEIRSGKWSKLPARKHENPPG